jgi:flagellar biosynthesis/type III secretory pathway chaperone
MNMQQRVDNLIDIITRLGEVLQQEMDLLRQMKVREIEPLQEIKDRLTDAYQARLNEIQKNIAAYQTLPPAARERLKRTNQKFREIVTNNMLAVSASRTANSSIVEMISEAVLAQQQQVRGYGADGGVRKSRKSAYELAAPTTINQQL